MNTPDIKTEIHKRINDLAVLNYEGKIKSLALTYLDENNIIQNTTVIEKNTELIMLAATDMLHDSVKQVVNTNFKPEVKGS